MRAGLILVPLDLRMSAEAVEGIVRASGARHLVLGTGRDAPDPREAGLDRFPTTDARAITAEPDDTFPTDWEAQLDALAAHQRPTTSFELVFTSGTTGTPKGVMLSHANVIASIETFHRIVPPMEHRIVSLLPLSHLLEQSVGLFYALSVGADILYVRSRNPRVIFDCAARPSGHLDGRRAPGPRPVLERDRARGRQARPRDRVRPRCAAIARRLPMRWRPRLFGSVHAQLGGHFRLFLSAGAFLPPALQQGWEDLGVIVLQGYGATETGTGQLHHARRPRPGHGRAGRRRASRCGSPTTARSSSAGRPSSAATGRTRPRPPRRSPPTAGTGPATSASSTTPGG